MTRQQEYLIDRKDREISELRKQLEDLRDEYSKNHVEVLFGELLLVIICLIVGYLAGSIYGAAP